MAYEDDEYVDDYEPETETQPSGGDDDWEPSEQQAPPLLPPEDDEEDVENAPPYQVAGPPMPPPAKRETEEDDWEAAPSGGFKPSSTAKTDDLEAVTAKKEDDWEPAPTGGFKPERGQEPRGLAERVTAGFRGGMGETEDPETHERRMEPLGISPENQAKYPALSYFQPFIAPLDFIMRAPAGVAGAAAGFVAGILEKNPDALLPYGLDRTQADQVQRELDMFGKAALADVGSHAPKAAEPAVKGPREPLPRTETPALPAEGTAPLPLESGATRTPQQSQLPLEPPRDQYRQPEPELPLRTPAGEQGQLPLPGEAGPRPAGRGGDLSTPAAPELPGPGGRIAEQTEMPLHPPTGREPAPLEPVRQGELLPPTGEQGQLPFPHQEAPTAEGKTQRHGTPGSTAAAGTAEAQPPPPTPRPGEPGWLTQARGPEDYGKQTPQRGAGGGMNVGEVDPTVASAIKSSEPPAAAATAARPSEAIRGPIPESPAGAQKPGGNIVRPLDARPTGELIQLARRGELSPFMRDSLANELERRGVRRMPEPAGAEPLNVGAQLRAREETARRATQEATAPGPVKRFLQEERGGGPNPLRRFLRDERGGGRPTEPPPKPVPSERQGPKLTSFERAKKMTNEQLQAEIARTDIPRVQKAVFSDALRARGEKPNPAAAAKTPTELRQTTPTIPTKGGKAISPARQAVRDRIAPDPTWTDKIPTSFKEAAELTHRGYEGVFNALHPYARRAASLERELGRPLEREEDFHRLARSIKGLGGKIESIYREGPYDPETRKVIGPALDPILKKIMVDKKAFEEYAVAKRVIEKEGQGIKTGVPLKEANQTVAELGSKWGQTFKELNDFQSSMLRMAKHLVGEEGIAKIEAANKDYIPLYRALDPKSEMGDMFRTGGGLTVKDPIEKMKGSERQIVNPLNSVLKNTAMLADLAEKNEVHRAMKRANDAVVKAGGDGFIRKSRSDSPLQMSTEQRQRMLDAGIPEDMIEKMRFLDAKTYASESGKLRYFENGKEQIYDIPKDMARVVAGFDRPAMNMLVKIAGTPARLLRAGATLTPEFGVKNIFRDQATAFIQAQGIKGYIPFYDAAMSMERFFKPEVAKEFNKWMREGGANSNLVSFDRKLLNIEPRSFYGKLENVVVHPQQIPRMMLDLLRGFSEQMENATRFGAHMRDVKSGIPSSEAAFRARELTIDFGRMGNYPAVRLANTLIPFFNANVQGLDRFARAFKNDPSTTFIKTMAAITVPSIALWMLNKDDPRYQELPQWQKMLFWIIPTNDWRNITPAMEKKLRADNTDAWFRKDPQTGQMQYNHGTLWRLPKPFAEGQIFGSIPERIMESFVQHKPNAFKHVADSVIDALSPSFIPQAYRPIKEQQANWSDFLQRPLMSPDTTAKKPQAQQFTSGTSETAKLLAGAIRSVAGEKPVGQLGSPIIIDNYIRQLSGGLGSHVVSGIDKALNALSGKELPPAPERTWADIPGIKAFVARFPQSGAQSIQDFYDLRKEGQTAKAGGDKNAWIGDETAKRLKGYRDAIEKFNTDKEMSPEDKRTSIDVTTLMMIEAAKRGIELGNKASQRQQEIKERKKQLVQ
jgi:hypothetical protein